MLNVEVLVSLSMNLVAADVRRLIHIFGTGNQSLLTSAATVQGFNARTLALGILTPAFCPRRRRNAPSIFGNTRERIEPGKIG
jgi:hypothetical protein